MHIKNKTGQSTVEYVLLVTAVVVVVIAFLSSTNNGGFQAQLGNSLGNATQEINIEAGILAGSHAQDNASTSTTGQTPPNGFSINPLSGLQNGGTQ